MVEGVAGVGVDKIDDDEDESDGSFDFDKNSVLGFNGDTADDDDDVIINELRGSDDAPTDTLSPGALSCSG